ncbi:MAG: hypothetical protein ACR2GY_06025 [Phycisphaerales bacterium]
MTWNRNRIPALSALFALLAVHTALAQRSYPQTREPVLQEAEVRTFAQSLDDDVRATLVLESFDRYRQVYDIEWQALSEWAQEVMKGGQGDTANIRARVEEWNTKRRNLFSRFVNDVAALLADEPAVTNRWLMQARAAEWRDWLLEIDPSQRDLELGDPFLALTVVTLSEDQQTSISKLSLEYAQSSAPIVHHLATAFDPLTTQLVTAVVREDQRAEQQARTRLAAITDSVKALQMEFRQAILDLLNAEQRLAYNAVWEKQSLPGLYRQSPVELAIERIRTSASTHDVLLAEVDGIEHRYRLAGNHIRREILRGCVAWTQPGAVAERDRLSQSLLERMRDGELVNPMDAKRTHPSLHALQQLADLERSTCALLRHAVVRHQLNRDPVLAFILNSAEPDDVQD